MNFEKLIFVSFAILVVVLAVVCWLTRNILDGAVMQLIAGFGSVAIIPGRFWLAGYIQRWLKA